MLLAILRNARNCFIYWLRCADGTSKYMRQRAQLIVIGQWNARQTLGAEEPDKQQASYRGYEVKQGSVEAIGRGITVESHGAIVLKMRAAARWSVGDGILSSIVSNAVPPKLAG